jgi:hypothetical protein
MLSGEMRLIAFSIPHSSFSIKKATRRAERDAWPILFPSMADSQ